MHRLAGGLSPAIRLASWGRLAAFSALALLLGGCLDLAPPILQVTPDSLAGLSAAQATLTVSNGGGRRLTWEVKSNHPRVAVHPRDGRLGPGASMTLQVEIDEFDVDKGESLAGLLTFNSNAGRTDVELSFTASSGIGICAGFTPEERIPGEGGLPAAWAVPGPGAVAVPGEVIVAYRGDPTGLRSLSETGAALRAEHGLGLIRGGLGGAPDLVSAADPEALIASLAADPRVRYAHRNYYLELQQLPDDPLFGEQWNLADFGMEQAWDRFYQDDQLRGEVVIAIIDSGVSAGHPDFAGKLVPGWDFRDNDANTDPGPSGPTHGTHVAGIAAARGNDAFGVAGVAFVDEVRLLPVKVFGDAGQAGTLADLIDAIRWSAGMTIGRAPVNANPAQVINMSLGVAGRYAGVDAAAEDAWAAGALLVGASGNHGGSIPDRGVISPANAPCVIAVGSVDHDRVLSAFSNTGAQLEMVAPGGLGPSSCQLVYSTINQGTHGCSAGTSMASPFVAGVAALVISQGIHTEPGEVRTRLSQTARLMSADLDPREYGNGLVCADLALGAATACGEAP